MTASQGHRTRSRARFYVFAASGECFHRVTRWEDHVAEKCFGRSPAASRQHRCPHSCKRSDRWRSSGEAGRKATDASASPCGRRSATSRGDCRVRRRVHGTFAIVGGWIWCPLLGSYEQQVSDAGRAGIDARCEVDVSIIMPCLNEAGRACPRAWPMRTKAPRADAWTQVRSQGRDRDSRQRRHRPVAPAIASKLGARSIHAASRLWCGTGGRMFPPRYGRFLIMGDADAAHLTFATPWLMVGRLMQGADLRRADRVSKGASSPAPCPGRNRPRRQSDPTTGILNILFRAGISDAPLRPRGPSHAAASIACSYRVTAWNLASEMVITGGSPRVQHRRGSRPLCRATAVTGRRIFVPGAMAGGICATS